MDVSYGQATLIISDQLGAMAGQVGAHEYGHIRDAVHALAAAKPAAERLEQVPYASKAQCEQACKDWEKDVRDTIDRAAAWRDGVMNWSKYWLTRK